MPSRSFLRSSFREQLGVYALATLSNIFLAASQYLAVSAAVGAYLPVDPGTFQLITNYGRVPGIFLALFLNSLLFQAVLLILVLTLAISAIVMTRWRRWAYAFWGVVVSGFVGYWLGAKFLVVLEWISTLQDNRIDTSNSYSGLFWFGLASSVCYVLMILLLRKSYGRLSETHLAEEVSGQT